MSLPPKAVTLPVGTRNVIVSAIDVVLRNARTGYAPATPGSPATGTVDFHPYAAYQVRDLVAAAAQDETIALTLTVQQVEALTKILKRSRYLSTPERRKLALEARRAINAAAGEKITDA